MHSLMTRVLDHRQLSSAGQLFSISHYDVISDLHSAFTKIKEIFNAPNYAENRIDQSVVEISIARITVAVRETECMELYCADLVDLLDSCLYHPMTHLDNHGNIIDSAHCRIASDLLSSLFLHYSKRSVMTLTLPVAIKSLSSSNPELARNTTSYLSLAAIHNAKPLSQYSIHIISLIINGNYALLRLLPQIYPEQRESFHAYLPQLLDLLQSDQPDCSEKLALLQFASMVADTHPDLILPYLPSLHSLLSSPPSSTAVLNIYMSLVSHGKSHYLSIFLPSLLTVTSTADSINLATLIKIIGNIGRISLPLATDTVYELMRSAETADKQLLPSILIQIEGIGEAWPTCLQTHLEQLKRIPTHGVQQIIQRIITIARCSSAASTAREITMIPIRNDNQSIDSLLSKNSIANQSTIFNSGDRTIFSVGNSSIDTSAQQLDRNTHSLALQYLNRSSGILSRNQSNSHASVNGQNENMIVDYHNHSQSSINPSIAGSSRNIQNREQLPSNLQIGKDGRIRPIASSRKPAQWPCGSYETTFPANKGPITTTMRWLDEKDEKEETQWMRCIDRSDVVMQFVEHRKNKIRRFVMEVTSKFPIPVQCTVEGPKTSKHRLIIHFACQTKSICCVFHQDSFFVFKTNIPSIWLHLMFLQMQASSLETTGEVVGQSNMSFITLAQCWKCLPLSLTKGKPFVTLVTSAFPTAKEQEKVMKEIQEASLFDCFSLDGINHKWTCFSCMNPEKCRSLIAESGSCEKVLEGELKEKKGRWKLFKRWNKKYFTLSSAALIYSNQQITSSHTQSSNTFRPAIDLKNIRSVRSLSRGRKSRRSLRKAFEIFTSDNNSVVLKAKDEKKAEQWLQCLQIAVAHAKRELS